MNSARGHSTFVSTISASEQPSEDFSAHEATLLGMTTCQEFIDYCNKLDISLPRQKAMIEFFRLKQKNLDFAKELKDYRNDIIAYMNDWDDVDTTARQPQANVDSELTPPPQPTVAEEVPQGPMQHFILTPKGVEKGFDAWNDMLKAMENLGIIPADEHGLYLDLLGVNHSLSTYRPLTQKVHFHRGYRILALWIGLMMGKDVYGSVRMQPLGEREPRDVRFQCPELIMAPGGHQWKLLQKSMLVNVKDEACPIVSTRSLTEARTNLVDTETALSIFRCLKPLGCRHK